MEYKKEAYANWQNQTGKNFLFYRTKDNSVSVSIASDLKSTELMHSVDGAFSETVYLYEDVVHKILQNPQVNYANFLSLGLGMGYVEILICSYALKFNIDIPIQIFSFELENELNVFFKDYFLGHDIPEIFYNAYEDIIFLFSKQYDLEPLNLKVKMKNWIENNKIKFLGPYSMETELTEKMNGIFFDAFSFNTSPDLWSDDLIVKMLNNCNEFAAFATYAARGHLKKCLKECGFQLDMKKGYGGKKESTFAYKG